MLMLIFNFLNGFFDRPVISFCIYLIKILEHFFIENYWNQLVLVLLDDEKVDQIQLKIK